MTTAVTTAAVITARLESWPLRQRFVTSHGAKTSAAAVVATVRAGPFAGRGECIPYPRYDETPAKTLEAIATAAPALARHPDRAALAALLPPGAARNALDCALWDLEAKRAGRRAWDLAGVAMPAHVVTAYSLSAEAPAAMADAARAHAGRPLLKIKLVGDGRDLERVDAVRGAAPAARLIVDANEGWTVDDYRALAPALGERGVALIEQPLHADRDAALAELPHPVPVCADESAHIAADVAGLASRYDAVNIKLDKSGGLTEALAMRDAARAAGMKVMVGCMLATSLSMAPALLVAAGADVVDLDAPLWLARDRIPALAIDAASRIDPPAAELWG
ncbi:MAG: N-acetyl-D-Glu racemase DgcA [Alphaproteobacteria bacterium]